MTNQGSENECPCCGKAVRPNTPHGGKVEAVKLIRCNVADDGFCCQGDSMGDPCSDDCSCGGFAA